MGQPAAADSTFRGQTQWQMCRSPASSSLRIRSQPLHHHIESLAEIGYVVQESLATKAACDRATPTARDVQPAIVGLAARWSARARQAAPVLPSWARAQRLRPAAALPPVFFAPGVLQG